MTLSEIWAMCKIGGVGLIALLTIVQISPIKLNPWKPLGNLVYKWLSNFAKFLNKEVIEQVKALQEDIAKTKKEVLTIKTDLSEVRMTVTRQGAIAARSRILSFGDELRLGLKHSKGHFDSILRDIRYYESYCKNDPDFENGVTEPTIVYIRAVYQECLSKNDFL